MVKRILAGAAAFSILSACVGSANDPGPYPSDYQQIVKDYLHANLKDPYSVRDLEIGPPEQNSRWTGLLYSGELYAWRSCVAYNAKNSFGAYIGIKSYGYYIRNGEVVYWHEGDC